MRRRSVGGGRRLSAELLRSQLAVVTVALLAGFGLVVQANRSALDSEYQQRALSIAAATASVPQIRAAMAAGDPDHAVAGAGRADPAQHRRHLRGGRRPVRDPAFPPATRR